MGLTGRTILCPICFRTFPQGKMEFACINTKCTTDVIEKPRPDKIGRCKCKDCGSMAVRQCPNCHKRLPPDIWERETRVISIVGVKGSGKSYYVGALLKQLRLSGALSSAYNLAISWDKEDISEYMKRYGQYFNNKVPIPGTDPTDDIMEKYPPILVKISKQVNKRFSGLHRYMYNFSFFDAAGENFRDEVILATITPYLQNSTAIMLILDPRQVQTVGDAIAAQFPEGTRFREGEMSSDVLNNILKVLHSERKNERHGVIQIPLYIAISKWDLVRNTPGLAPENLAVNRSQLSSSDYDAGNAENISSELRSLLMKWDSNLVTLAEQSFSEVQYFAFSAWGTPDSANNGVPEITPYRVEDPLMWELHREKVI